METDKSTEINHPAAAGSQQDSSTRSVERIQWWQRWAMLPVVLLLKLWGRSLRITIEDETIHEISAADEAIIGVLWHNRLFFAREALRRYRPGHTLSPLISTSRDGAWLTALFTAMGMTPIRGSSSWRGIQATRELVRASRNNIDIGITPDGPRGPRYECKRGVAVISYMIKRPIYLLGFECRHAFRLRSWDQFMIPYPFTKVKFRIERLTDTLPNSGKPRDVDALSQLITERLRAINQDVDLSED